jgi:predicted nucleotidyltransferase
VINIEKIKPEVERICRRLPVKRLGLFGSALDQNFSQNSDIDVLVVFDSGENIDLFDKYFELKEHLEEVFKREVDKTLLISFRQPRRYKSLFAEWISRRIKPAPLPRELSKETLKSLDKLLTELRTQMMSYWKRFPSIAVS